MNEYNHEISIIVIDFYSLIDILIDFDEIPIHQSLI